MSGNDWTIKLSNYFYKAIVKGKYNEINKTKWRETKRNTTQRNETFLTQWNAMIQDKIKSELMIFIYLISVFSTKSLELSNQTSETKN